jgi:outer membrane protein assembly factor BamA
LKKILCIVFCLLSAILCIATAGDTTKNGKKDKKLEIRLVPVISYAPETGFLFGIGALTPFKCSQDSATKHSLISAFVAYSQYKQYYYYMPYQIFSKHSNYYFEGEADYYKYSYYYWGIGENRVPQELYNVSYPKIFLNAFRKIFPHFYVGLDYYFEDDVMCAPLPSEIPGYEVPGANGGVISGGGLDILYDTRDHIFFPHHGWYIKGVSYFNTTQLGSTLNFERVVTDASWYQELARPIVLAVTQHNQFSWGDVPFNQLAEVGGTKQIRGYYMGYYRDDVLSYVQAEARINLIGRLGFVAFGTMAFYGNYQTFPETPTPVFAEGVGLRYNYEKKEHINLRFDVGYGYTIEYYLTIQEAF